MYSLYVKWYEEIYLLEGEDIFPIKIKNKFKYNEYYKGIEVCKKVRLGGRRYEYIKKTLSIPSEEGVYQIVWPNHKVQIITISIIKILIILIGLFLVLGYIYSLYSHLRVSGLFGLALTTAIVLVILCKDSWCVANRDKYLKEYSEIEPYLVKVDEL